MIKKDCIIATHPKIETNFFYLVLNYGERELMVYSERRGRLEKVTESFTLGQDFIFGSHDEGRINFKRLNSPDDERILRQIENLSPV